MTEKPPFRIAPGQASMARSMQALMTANIELQAFVYRGPYQLAEREQREALLHVLNTEFNTTIDLPAAPPVRRVKKREGQPGTLIAHLVVIDNQPVIFYEENDVVAAVFGFILGRYGMDAARRVSFRAGMIPPETKS